MVFLLGFLTVLQRDNFYDLLLASLDLDLEDEALLKGNLLLKKTICSLGSKFSHISVDPKGDKKENGRISFLENVRTYQSILKPHNYLVIYIYPTAKETRNLLLLN